MKTGLHDKVALVTGGASGIGRASCLVFATEGAKVVVVDRDLEGGEKTVAMVRDTGAEAIFVRCDVSNTGEVEVLVKRTLEAYGRLDCAHNNAGIAGPMVRAADCSEQDWDEVIRVNLKGVWLCMRYQIAQMVKQHSGVIVNTTSTAGLRGSRLASAYAASSHGIVGLTKSAALEYIGEGIRINAVCPGIVDTPMIQRYITGDAKREAQFKTASPIGRMAAPDEIAKTVVWLCSDASSYVSGSVVIVDGGRTAQ
jgi:NAD(P)-dependent dehydrogenase (short-subunit alcohol dehydrogenase family)